MKILLFIMILCTSLCADEVQIRPLDPDDAVALRVAGESLRQAQEKYNALVKKLEDKILYERHSDHSGSIYFIKLNSEDKEWKVTSDYKAFVLVPKEPDIKKTCLIGIGNYR